MGGYTGRDREPGGRKYPPEDPAEGCPGGWRASIFNMSIDPYIRLRTDTGGRVPNRRLDECDDPLVWEWINYYERQQERCIAHTMKLHFDRLERER